MRSDPRWVFFESVPDATVVVDVSGQVVFANAQAAELFATTREQLEGHGLEHLLPERHRGVHGMHMRGYFAHPRTRAMGTGLELFALRSDGVEVPVEISLGPLPHEGVSYVVASIRDVSERRSYERELGRAKAEAEAANHAKSEFLSSMSHELRTPLNAILGFAQLLLRDRKIPLHEKHRGYAEHVLHGGEHLLRLIDEVLDLAKIESGKVPLSPEPFDLGVLMAEVVATLAPVAERSNVQIACKSSAALRVFADRMRVSQILLNFASNAIKYAGAGCSVELSLVPSTAGRVRVYVRDDGVGIALDKQDKLFQPFYRAGQEAGSIEGTGIGLAISKRLAGMMEGAVDFHSVPGEGSSFWLDLPECLADDTELAGDPESKAVPLDTDAERLVLYVEDNPASVVLMQELLASIDGVRLLTAPSAELGIELAAAHRPDLIILDLNLPGMSGYQALQRLREQPSLLGTKVIALSAAATERDKSRARDAGFARYFTKPLRIDELENALAELLPS